MYGIVRQVCTAGVRYNPRMDEQGRGAIQHLVPSELVAEGPFTGMGCNDTHGPVGPWVSCITPVNANRRPSDEYIKD